MKLTCVTATFNCIAAGNRERLVRCIESVAKLNTEYEHLIYDGASTDGTVELLRELEKATRNLKVISEPDTGIYNALNKGVRDAKGEWFYVLGSDDYILHPEVLDRLLFQYNCDQIVTPAITVSGIRHITNHRIFLGTPYCHQGVIQKTAILRKFEGFDERYRIAADYDLFLKFHIAGMNIQYVDSSFAYFSKTGLSSTCSNGMHAEFDKISSIHFIASPEYIAKFRRRSYVSITMVFPYLFHSDCALRNAARFTVKQNVKGILRVVFWPAVVARRWVRCMCQNSPII